MGCLLARESPAGRMFFLRQFRLMWTQAGGTVDTMPEAIRVPGDPPPRLLPQPQPARAKPARQVPQRGQPAPVVSSNPPAIVLPPPPPSCERPRVLFVSHDLNAQGAQRILLNLLPQLRGMTLACYPLQGGILRPLFEERGIRLVDQFIPQEWDLVVANTLASHPALTQAKAAQLPALWFIHEWGLSGLIQPGKFEELAAWVRKSVLAHASQKSQFPSLKESATVCIPSVIPPIVPRKRMESRKALGIEEKAVLAVNFGRDEARKGQEDLRLAAKGQGLRVEFVAGQTDPYEWLAAADIYVSTSRAECYPLSIQEAKAHQLRVFLSTRR
jgi:hypothetical protein